MAQKFEALIRSDDRFEIPAARHLGMVVFRLKGDNELTERLLKRLNSSGKMHAVPASLKGKYVIRNVFLLFDILAMQFLPYSKRIFLMKCYRLLSYDKINMQHTSMRRISLQVYRNIAKNYR